MRLIGVVSSHPRRGSPLLGLEQSDDDGASMSSGCDVIRTARDGDATPRRRNGRLVALTSGYETGMARSIWSGTISFGLVNVPVKAFTAVHEHTVHFNQLEKGSGA